MEYNLTDIQDKTIVAVKEVAAFLQAQLGKIQQGDIETKSLNSLVTYVDKISEEMLVAALRKIIPDAVFLTEENTVEQQQGAWQWIIDPLDGTTNFIHQVPVFAISVGLQYEGEMVVGVVHEVNRDECFSATKGGGAFLNGKSIAVTKTQQLSESLIATGFPYYDFDFLDAYLNVFKFLMTNTRGVRRLGSAAVDLCYTACGRFDGYFEYSLSPWDVAAGALIVREAGGHVADFKGGDNWLHGRQIVAGNPAVASLLLDKLKVEF